jgi:hypothetical protein
MAEKISQYNAKSSFNLKDLMDISNTNDGGTTYDESQKATLEEFILYLRTKIGVKIDTFVASSDGEVNYTLSDVVAFNCAVLKKGVLQADKVTFTQGSANVTVTFQVKKNDTITFIY